MRADSLEIAQNQKNLQYYSYVRRVMQQKQMSYWIGNPSVQIISGVIYFKTGQNIETNIQLDSYETYLKQYRHAVLDGEGRQKITKTLALVGIPNSKSPVQACEKLMPYMDWIVEMKVVKANCFKYYAILMLLKDQDVADKFYREVMGDQYNGVEIQRLLLREMVEVSYTRTQTTRAEKDELFQHHKKSSHGEDLLQKRPVEEIFISCKNQKSLTNIVNCSSPKKKQLFISCTANQSNKNSESSICAICLQQSSGTLISILCCHYFHLKCLSQWKEIICPLCRYDQQPPLIKFCQKCNQCQGLWICLICGVRLCCGLGHDILGKDSHIYQHYLVTAHRLSMNVETKFIFDATQLSFLHQMFYKEIIKNNQIEMMESQKNNIRNKKTKLNRRISQYEYNISEEMQKQRKIFEQTINREVKIKKQNIKEKKKYVTQMQNQLQLINKQLANVEMKFKQCEGNVNNLQKQIKGIKGEEKQLKTQLQKSQKQQSSKQQQGKRQLKKYENLIKQKKQQLTNIKNNLIISQKLKNIVGQDTIQNSVILELGNKKKKK